MEGIMTHADDKEGGNMVKEMLGRMDAEHSSPIGRTRTDDEVVAEFEENFRKEVNERRLNKIVPGQRKSHIEVAFHLNPVSEKSKSMRRKKGAIGQVSNITMVSAGSVGRLANNPRDHILLLCHITKVMASYPIPEDATAKVAAFLMALGGIDLFL